MIPDQVSNQPPPKDGATAAESVDQPRRDVDPAVRSGLRGRFSTPYALPTTIAGACAVVIVVAGLIVGSGSGSSPSQSPVANGRPAATGPAGQLPLGALIGLPTSAGAGTPATASAAPSVRAAVTPAGPAVPAVQSVAGTGQVVQNTRVAGRADGQSVLYNGRSVWVFNDTTLQNPWGFMASSASATTDLDASNGVSLQSSSAFTTASGTPSTLIPLTSAEQAFETAHASASGCKSATDQYCGVLFGILPGPVVADPARHRVLVFYSKICFGGGAGTPCTGAFGTGLGGGVAALDMNSGTVTRLTTGGTPLSSVEGADPTLLFPADQVFTAAALVVGSDVYDYGSCTFAGCELGRVPLAQVNDRSAWRYHTSSGGWTADAAGSDRLIGPGGAGQSVFYDPALREYVNVFMPYNSDDVDYQVADEPYGPWSKTVTATHTPGGTQDDFGLIAHPEYAQNNGLVEYLSYYHPATGALNLLELQFKAP